MSRARKYISLLLGMVMLLGVGCIKNDLPYPVVELLITSIEIEGALTPPVIDEVAHTVEVELEEQTDIQNVEISSVTYTQGATASRDIVGKHDMRSPLHVTLSLYQHYPWKISAKQNISREFTVEGQIGATEWDIEKRTATAYVGFEDHSNIQIKSLKLAAADITTYEWADGVDPNDFSSVRYVYVTCHGRTERWDLYVKTTDVVVDIVGADAWGKVMWLYGEGLSGTDLGFKYRQMGSEEWLTAQDVKVEGGSFSACVKGLQTNTEYEVMAYSGENVTEVVKVTTEDVYALPNAGFEEWSTNNNIVYPFLADSAPYWNTGNDGAAIAGTTLTEPTSDVRPGSEGMYAASLQSKKASLMGIGKFAAGNLFTGTFAMNGLDGIVTFGRDFNFTARPASLSFWMKNNEGTIDEGSHASGTDIYTIMVLITDGTTYAVNTKDTSTFLTMDSLATREGIIAYGYMQGSDSRAEWTEETINITYREDMKSVTPKKIVVSFTPSGYGDYFCGSTSSWMYVDDIVLNY